MGSVWACVGLLALLMICFATCGAPPGPSPPPRPPPSPPAPPPGAPPPKVVKECCEEIPGVRPAKCCVYPAGEPQPIPCCADRCGAENVCPSLLPPDAGGAAARRLGDVYRRDAP